MGIIYITRHGETEWNAEGRIQGHTDVPLSERGREQAQMLARRLAGVRIDAAYSSDLSRAAETARVALGERDVPLAFTSDLREYNKGVFEGMTAAEYQRKFPHLFEASMENDLDFAPPEGETIRETSHRLGPDRAAGASATPGRKCADCWARRQPAGRPGIAARFTAGGQLEIRDAQLFADGRSYLPQQLRAAPVQRHFPYRRHGAGLLIALL